MLDRRSVLGAAFLPLNGWTQTAATIRWVVPFPPGGGADLATRIVAKRFGEKLGRTVVADNKPGAATTIAAQQAVARGSHLRRTRHAL